MPRAGFRAGWALAVWSGFGVAARSQHPGGRRSANRPAVSPGAARSRASRPGARVHRSAPRRSRDARRAEGRARLPGRPDADRRGVQDRRPGAPSRACSSRRGPSSRDFAKTQPNHPLAREALVQIARMLIERGHVALLLGRRVSGRHGEGREAGRGAQLLHRGQGRLRQGGRAAWSRPGRAFPVSLPKGDPRIEERDKIYAAHLDAVLQKAVADYELAQTYPAGSKERTANLTVGPQAV